MAETSTVCPYCGVGCGLRVEPGDGRAAVTPDVAHPANRGRVCSKGAALGETLGEADRLLRPEIGGTPVSWEAALGEVAGRLRSVIETHGPQAVAFYVSGQLLTEDYYVANKLMKGFIGAANIDTNSRLCMSSAVAAYKRTLGEDAVPCSYEDLEQADLLVFVGSNAAWTHPVLYQRVAAEKRRRPELRVVVVDPRRTPTCDIADLHLALRPGSDAWLFDGLLSFLAREDGLNRAFLDAHTQGLDDALAAARAAAPSIPAVAAACELPAAQVAEFFRLFLHTEKTVTLWSQGLNQSSSGVDKGVALINCHLATGRIGRPGMGPFSLTGQPNAMGGREVGGLANQLAAHMDIEDADARDRLARFWGVPAVAATPGFKAVDLFEAVADGRIKAVWIMATNPVVSLPDGERVRAALAACEHVIVSDCVRGSDTVACADVLLPAATWGEKDGTVTNSERRISRMRAFLPPPGEARPDWWIVTEVARRLGHGDAFTFRSPADIFREHAALSGFENGGARLFDIGALADLDDAAYDALAPVQWPVTPATPSGTTRLFADGCFATADGRALLLPVAPRPPAVPAGDEYPLVLNTGRIRDQWHTMTRTARTPRLTTHMPEPFVQIHPLDADLWHLAEGGLARLSSPHGGMLARVKLDAAQRPGSVFVPMHWSETYARDARANVLTAAVTDPVSGQPEFKHAPVRVEPFRPDWTGFLLSRSPLEIALGDYRVHIPSRGFHRYELAGEEEPEDWGRWVQAHLLGPGEWMEYADPAAGRYRCARLRDGRLELVFFVAPGNLPERSWLGQMFAEDYLDDVARMSLLAGRPSTGMQVAGRPVCSCFGVGFNTLVEAIDEQGLTSVEAIGEALRAGTNCGSCIPELREILAQAQHSA
ncbi:nitrate reductase [Acidihalobacter aeolianus]|uniref:Nitrate reductase n=1 Tax=Acidihalobacter aeolianus TaxID=2792603 RepID=A0A1D8K8U4_9GAMM|nr:nitrate reductase [Acidihalobacter aeolianus]AOV17394.1 nitrate reductase [Acidihalobacter aeolianus]